MILRIIAAIARRFRHQIVLYFARKRSIQSLKNRRGNNILVLCYGNIYRSPLAEYVLNKYCSELKIESKSAGFHEKDNRSCDPEYLSILKERGYDLSAHRSKRVTVEDTSWSDLIVIMDRKNWDMLQELDPNSQNKTLWIGAFSNVGGVEVIDPYGKDKETLDSVINNIEICISDICRKLSTHCDSIY